MFLSIAGIFSINGGTFSSLFLGTEDEWVVMSNYLLIFVSKVLMVIFGFRSFENYLKGNAFTSPIIKGFV